MVNQTNVTRSIQCEICRPAWFSAAVVAKTCHLNQENVEPSRWLKTHYRQHAAAKDQRDRRSVYADKLMAARASGQAERTGASQAFQIGFLSTSSVKTVKLYHHEVQYVGRHESDQVVRNLSSILAWPQISLLSTWQRKLCRRGCGGMT